MTDAKPETLRMPLKNLGSYGAKRNKRATRLTKEVGVKFEAKAVTIAPAPRFSGTAGGPSLATIYFSHYQRLNAILAAARTGNESLIAMAVAAQDAKGCDE